MQGGVGNKERLKNKYPGYPIIIDDIEDIIEAQEKDDFHDKYELHFNLGIDKEPYLIDKEIMELARSEKNSLDSEKNALFNQELAERGLCLAVSRTHGNRTLPVKSKEWRKLRQEVLERSDYTCRFCDLKSKTWMVCDHIDGDASNNSLENLGINCPICDLIRHCGRAGIYQQLSIWESDFTQLEIVKMTQLYWKENNRIPDPLEIDPNAVYVGGSRGFGGKLMKVNYSELSERELRFRGFFTEDAKSAFEKVLS